MFIIATMLYLVGPILLIIALVQGSIRFGPSILFILFSYIFVLLSVLQGGVLAFAPVDFSYHDTWFVTGHEHYAMFGGLVFAIFGGTYELLAKRRNSISCTWMGYTHFLLTLLTTVVLFWSYSVVGLNGMPRLLADYATIFEPYHSANTYLTIVLLFSQLLFIAAITISLFGRKQMTNDSN